MQASTPYLHTKAWPLSYLLQDPNLDIHVLVWLEFSKWNIFGQALSELTADRNNSGESWFSSTKESCSGWPSLVPRVANSDSKSRFASSGGALA